MNARQFSVIFGNDGQNWTSHDGRSFEDVMTAEGIKPEYGYTLWDADSEQYITVPTTDRTDKARYEFLDGSAVVVAGDAWAIEGDEPFSWDD